MQAIPGYTAPSFFESPTECWSEILDPKYLSRIRMLNPDIIDLEMINILGGEAFRIFLNYLEPGAIYTSDSRIILKQGEEIKIYSRSILNRVNVLWYTIKNNKLEKHECFLFLHEFHQTLDHYIAQHNPPAGQIDLITTRYYEMLPIDITMTKTASQKFKEIGDDTLMLSIMAGAHNVVSVSSVFFKRLESLFTDTSQVNALVAPTLSNRRALQHAQNTLKTVVNERFVILTSNLKDHQNFSASQMSCKLRLGKLDYSSCHTRVTESDSRLLRIFIGYRNDFPWVEMEVQVPT